MESVAIIPARGGSKRIPRKNIKSFRGRPIISYSIETALKSRLFDKVIVSTDDEEIAAVSKSYGAEVPFLRSAATSDDFTTTAEVIVEVVGELKIRGELFDLACAIYPTAPFVSTESLKKGFDLLVKNKYTTVLPVCAFSYPIYRSFKLSTEGRLEMLWPENINRRSQDLPAVYHDAGQFYWINLHPFLHEKRLFSSNSGAIVVDELHVHDIDTENDWSMAEMKYSLLFPGNE